jgi:hypothetical protein
MAEEYLVPHDQLLRLQTEAKSVPGGWVYQLDGEFGPNDDVPPSAIVGAWKVDENGMMTSEFIRNPNYGSVNS